MILIKPTNYKNQIISFAFPCLKLSNYGEHTFQYDAQGCRIQKNQIYYKYNHQNRLFKQQDSLHTIYFFYNGNSLCSLKIDGQNYLLLTCDSNFFVKITKEEEK